MTALERMVPLDPSVWEERVASKLENIISSYLLESAGAGFGHSAPCSTLAGSVADDVKLKLASFRSEVHGALYESAANSSGECSSLEGALLFNLASLEEQLGSLERSWCEKSREYAASAASAAFLGLYQQSFSQSNPNETE